MDKVCRVAKVAVSPVVSVANVIVTSASKRLKVADDDFSKKIAFNRSQGTDLAAATTHKFIAMQFKLIPYRIVRLQEELAYAATLEPIKNLDLSEWYKIVIFELRFLIRLVFAFMAFVVLGRRSFYPPVPPTSKFLPGLKYMGPGK